MIDKRDKGDLIDKRDRGDAGDCGGGAVQL